jgi:hypothetical protein
MMFSEPASSRGWIPATSTMRGVASLPTYQSTLPVALA